MPDDSKLPEPAAWTLRECLAAKQTTTRGILWFSDPVNSGWVGLYTADQVRAAVEANTAQRKPLTREQIAEACRPLYVSARAAEMALPGDIDTARAIEAAHGIPAPKGGSES